MKIKWGVIGCGGIADRRTLPGMMLAENAELVAVMDANREAADRCKEKYNAKYAFDKAEDLLADVKLNGSENEIMTFEEGNLQGEKVVKQFIT